MLLRILQGEESVGVAFWTTLGILAIFFAYDTYMPTFSDFYSEHFRFLRVGFLTFVIVGMHNCAANARWPSRLAARAWVIALFALAAYTVYNYYGRGYAIGYLPATMAIAYLVKGD